MMKNRVFSLLVIAVLLTGLVVPALACTEYLSDPDYIAEIFNDSLRTCYFSYDEDMDQARAFMQKHFVTYTTDKKSCEKNPYANADGTRLDVTNSCITVDIPWSISAYGDDIIWWLMCGICSEVTVDDAGCIEYTGTYYGCDHFGINRTTNNDGIKYIIHIFK